MKGLNQLLTLLEKKRAYFLTYEKETEGLLFGDVQDMEKCMEERQRLIKEIDSCDREIKELCGEDKALCQAVKASCKRGELPEKYQEVYDRAMAVRAVWARLADSELQAEIRMKQEQLDALEQIKSANRGQGAQAARYYQSMGGKRTNDSPFGNA